jgi:4-amino-4-deoxy-L-arabinose transferase-like glycosyltransferase
MDERNKLWPFVILFAFYLFLAAVLPAVDDEYYYWCWSKDVQWSYYDHPPMTAALIRLSTWLFGDTVLAFRIPACISSTFAILVISRLTPVKLFVWAVVLTPLFTIFAVVITPDSPLVFCWSAYLWWLVELQRRLNATTTGAGTVASSVALPIESVISDAACKTSVKDLTTSNTLPPGVLFQRPWLWWGIGGVILGCGALSKYTMAIAVPAGFLSFLLARQPLRKWLPGYLLHGMIAFVVASPILIYNVEQHFEPLLFQLRHSAERTPSALRSFGDFVGVQILAFGTIPFFLFPWVCYHARSLSRDSRLRVSLSLYALPLAFFLYKSTQARLEGNWAIVCFISFWPLASEWYRTVRSSKFWRWSTAAGFLPPVLSVVAITIHLIWPVPIVPVKADRIHRQIALNMSAAKVADLIRSRGETLPVYTDTYQSTALLRFQSLDARQVADLSRPSHFTRPPRRLTDVNRAYFVGAVPLPPEFCEGFEPPQLLDSVPVIYRGESDRTMHIWLYAKRD